jgi:hypothetical protein
MCVNRMDAVYCIAIPCNILRQVGKYHPMTGALGPRLGAMPRTPKSTVRRTL